MNDYRTDKYKCNDINYRGDRNLDLTDVVAISYAHEGISFNEKVIGFANCLREKHGYNVIIDELLRQQETAIDFNEMMSKLIPNANKVIVILNSSEYKHHTCMIEKL